MNYDYWKAALAGEKPPMYVDHPECGFYRSGIYEKQENKARKRIGWKPVAIFMQTGDAFPQPTLMAAVNGSMVMDRDRINELWSYCAAYPISEETYRAVAERGEGWPDSHETVAAIPQANSIGIVLTADEVANAKAEGISLQTVARRKDPHDLNMKVVDAGLKVGKYAVIESDEQSSQARSLQHLFLDLRGEAADRYEEFNRPLLEKQKELRATWFPIRDRADEAAKMLRDAMGKWEDTKRQAARLAAEAAEKAAREHAQAAAKAAEANQPPPPPPEPAKSNVPAPSSQIRGGAGRAASVSVAVFVTAIDEDKVFAQFKGNPELTALLTSLAQKAVRAGIPVPGATTEERSVVR